MDQGVIAALKMYYRRQSLQEMIRQMDTSGVSLKEYWEDYNILKATDNIKMAWEEVTVSYMKGVWHRIWPSNENYGTNCDNLDMLVKERSEIADEVGLDSVDPVGITEVLESHSQPLSNEELYDLAQQLTEQQKEDEFEEDRGTNEMQKKDLTDILSAIDIPAEKLCDIDTDWECSCTVKRGIRAMPHPYYEILQEKKQKSKQLTFHSFLMSSEPQPGPSPAK